MPEQSLWVWDERVNQYRETATGRFIGIEKMNSLRDVYQEQQNAVLKSFTQDYIDGNITIQQYSDQCRKIIKNTYIDMYSMGRGGRNNMSQADWGRVGGMLKEQYSYFDKLMGQIERGEISPAQAMARLKMYINSANEAMWRGYVSNLPFKLPAYPGDGSTECLTNCRCEWYIVQIEGVGYDCYWRLGEAEHCGDCVEHSTEWNPWKWPESRNA